MYFLQDYAVENKSDFLVRGLLVRWTVFCRGVTIIALGHVQCIFVPICVMVFFARKPLASQETTVSCFEA